MTTSQTKQIKSFGLFSILAALMLTLLLEALDQTIVGTAMPRIIAQFHGLDRYGWVVTAYTLASLTMIPIVGKLSDQFGRKWFLLSGTILFLLGSLLAGASQNMDQLIAFRAIQGLGAGIGMALVITVIADLFPPAERAKWSGLMGAVYGFSNLFGPTIGGWLTEHGFLLGSLVTEATRWRWVFYINLPVGLLALIALFIYLPAHFEGSKSEFTGWAAVRRIDFAGAILASAATISLMLGLTWGSDQTFAWNSWQIISLLSASVVLFGLFIVVERKAVDPILPLDLFRNQVFTASALVGVCQMMVLIGLALYLPLFLQGVLTVSPTAAGMIMTPLSLSVVMGAMIAGTLANVLKRYQVIMIVAAVVMSVGTFLVTLMTPSTAIWQSILYMVLAGVGIGVFFMATTTAQNALPQNSLGAGTAAVRYLGQIGAALGIAVVGTVVNSTIPAEAIRSLPTSEAGKMALAGALQHGFVAVLVFAVLAIVITLFLKDIPMTQTNPSMTGELVAEGQPESEKSELAHV